MFSLGSIVFLNAWVLAGLLALPVLWWLLRAIPPSPRVKVFAGVRLLLGLEDEERQSDRTPWWLLALRTLALAAAIIGFSQPVLNPSARLAGGDGPLLVLMDQGWASAPDWAARNAAARAALDDAEQSGRQIVFWRAATDRTAGLLSPTEAKRVLASTEPAAWAPDHAAVLAALNDGTLRPGETIWLHDGLSHGEETGALRSALAGLGSLRLIGPETLAVALTPPRLENGRLAADVLRTDQLTSTASARVIAFATTPEGGERRIAVAQADFAEGDTRATAIFDLPTELQGQVTRLMLMERPSAGGATFADGSVRRVSAVAVAPENEGDIASLTSPAHYLTQAVEPWADLSRTDLGQALAQAPAALILIDQGAMAPEDQEAVTTFVEDGGLLIRFAGPRLAAAIGENRFSTAGGGDPLLPVRLRRGGRVLGGALAWSAPRTIGPFPAHSPFRGLTPPEEVAVRTQVLAEPAPDLSGKIWAMLDDGTPLVTAKKMGSGHVVLFHVSSDAEWSSLPLSGLFVEMLGRLMTLAAGRGADLPPAEELADTLWRAELLMGYNGHPTQVSNLQDPVAGERFLDTRPGADLPPGIYARANRTDQSAGDSIVINLIQQDSELTAAPVAPAGAIVETLGGVETERYGPWLLTLALVLVAIDVLATLFVSGRLGSVVRSAALVLVAVVLGAPAETRAQETDPAAVAATAETTLGYVLTGNPRIDRVSERAMVGLGNALARRTAVEPGPPVGVTPKTDPLAFYPVLYWPLTAETVPDHDGLEALARYLNGGGLLIIDTQNGASGFGNASAVQMRDIARALNLPPLAPVDEDHVLSRTFYLLTVFPGRWRGGTVWAEAAPPKPDGVDQPADIPQFDRVDDNVSPVIVGSADWAAAWAVDERGYPLFAIGRPGDRQREMAIRFGVNAVMYALTGNYKSDQVHAPAVLQRLGQ